MKKHIMLVLAIFYMFILSSHLFAFDLWNGLNTDMTKDQVVLKAREVLRVTNPNQESFGAKLDIFNLDKANLNNQFPENLVEIDLSSPLPDYIHVYYLNDPIPNVSIFFSNNKLLAVRTLWEISSAQLFEMIKSQKGNPTEIIIATNNFNGVSLPCYIWEESEKVTYCTGKNMCVVNKQLIKK
ncbi:hypothetical protein LQZ19_15585 [Treponema primitia]|uniref:hypothetical protein n=1 Tax=Treponema primitia TaxID=88058 RepID=UPI00397FCBA6